MQASASMARQLSTADGERSERTACEGEERKEEKEEKKIVVNSAEKRERKKSEKRKLIRKRK